MSPENNADYDVSEENFTTTPPIQFRARVLPQELNWQGEIQWTLDVEYDTTISRGPWTSHRAFQTQNDAIHEEQYVSEGGRINATAIATLTNDSIIESEIDITITGVNIPANVITARLIALYNGATPNLLTGIATRESGCYCQFYQITKYNVAALWPRESNDGGSHIGIMQVPVSMDNAWNWLTNTQVADDIIMGNIQQSHTHVNNLRAAHPGLRDLTAIEHENNALSIYRIGGYYYVPNANFTDWIPNPNNNIGVNYANDIRNNLQ